MMFVRKIISLLLALPLVFIVGHAHAAPGTTNADLEISYHGALGHITADVTDGDAGMLEKW
jgi:hypothetical protein